MATVVPLLFVGVVTAALVTFELHRGLVYSRLWFAGYAAEAVAYLIALLVYVTMTIFLVSRRRIVAVTVGVVLVAAGLASGPILWNPAVRAEVRYALERPAFAKVVALSRQGRLASGADDYYGPRLPGYLCYLAVDCRVATIGESGGEPVLFLPDYVGIPDDAVSFAHFAGEASGQFDGFGMLICPTRELGDGWWWMDAC